MGVGSCWMWPLGSTADTGSLGLCKPSFPTTPVPSLVDLLFFSLTYLGSLILKAGTELSVSLGMTLNFCFSYFSRVLALFLS